MRYEVLRRQYIHRRLRERLRSIRSLGRLSDFPEKIVSLDEVFVAKYSDDHVHESNHYAAGNDGNIVTTFQRWSAEDLGSATGIIGK